MAVGNLKSKTTYQKSINSRKCPPIEIRHITDSDRAWVREQMVRLWHASQVVVHDQVYFPHQLPGLIASIGNEPAGLLTYSIQDSACEVVTLDSWVPDCGVGSSLIRAVEQAATQAGCCRLWLVATNDNLRALGFYQKRGFRLVRVDAGAADRARKVKPEIPTVGENGIPLHDELYLEKILDS